MDITPPTRGMFGPFAGQGASTKMAAKVENISSGQGQICPFLGANTYLFLHEQVRLLCLVLDPVSRWGGQNSAVPLL